ncbi:MAG: tetratricopeptide repeat protein [Acidobacteriota bacterium]|nr:tetratricopeptide repeat protein [Acidobacteriota bacterium]
MDNPRMRNLLPLSILIGAALVCGACGSSEQSKSSTGGAEATATTPTTKTPVQSAPTGDAPPVSIAHGTPPAAGGQSGMDTAALDKKVEQVESKAKAPGATQADKTAAAAAYLERGNVFYIAGNPSLYKFALRDFRRALRYDPNNAEARAKQQQITEIYQSMGRPVPDLGNEL